MAKLTALCVLCIERCEQLQLLEQFESMTMQSDRRGAVATLKSEANMWLLF